MKYFQVSPQTVAKQLNSDLERGLQPEQVRHKHEICGNNALEYEKKGTFASYLAAQFKDFMIIVLIVAALVSATVAFFQQRYFDLIDAAVIIVIVLLNGLFGVLQHIRAEKTLFALRQNVVSQAKVIRGGKEKMVDAIDLVPGDVVILTAGDSVPADGRVVECSSLRTNEMVLTGESLPAEKNIREIQGDNHSPGDLYNMVFAGTLVVYGEAKIIVTSIGMETQIGKIAGMLHSETKDKTPLQIQMAQMGKLLSLMTAAVCLIIFILGIIEGRNLIDMFLTAVSLAVAAIPEGLAATVTIVLALGIRMLLKQNVVVKKLSSVETLGTAEVICTDKTGTLTQNRMSVVSCCVNGKIYPFKRKYYRDVAELIFYGSMCNKSTLQTENGHKVCVGDPTEGAIIFALEDMGKDKAFFDKQYPRMAEIPFDSERKCMSAIHVVNGRNLVIVKGAPESVLSKCSDDEQAEVYMKSAEFMSSKALRVLAIAVKEIDIIPPELFWDDIESELTCVGLVGMMDPPKANSLSAISACRAAGIRPVMITGDHIITARALAKQIGILSSDDLAMTGAKLDTVSQEELENSIEKYTVFARLSPEQKLRVVKAWQSRGKTVVMTGDGINDAPALQRADIGCAVASGNAVAKEAADIVLLDDNFATIVSSIQQGRGIYNNIKKTVKYFLSGNIGEVLAVLGAILLLFELPLIPLQLLWLNVFICVLPALALGGEKARDALMNHPPRNKKESLIGRRDAIDILFRGVLLAAVSLFAYVIGTGFHPMDKTAEVVAVGRTMSFGVLALSQIWYAFDCRSKHPIWKVGFFSNKYMNGAALISLMLMLFVMLVPGVQQVFGFINISGCKWIIILLISLISFAVCQIIKMFFDFNKN